ncbi:hypothetical protein DH2020_019428 [Rehmannia glutinosa]|uniref:Uncharacterized protein n=1 Tax=Rehmannia glutinosa TaxID=99300 RepID=A0ABR0WPF9_REHGL
MEIENSLAIATLPSAHESNQVNQDGLIPWSFPKDFVFGSGTGAYQVEGAALECGKSVGVWDDFTLRTPGRILDGSNGNVACDTYNKFKEDIKMMKKMGLDAYRFSISWPRILPGGRCSAGINREGIDYYNNVIDTVLAHGMKPYVTIFHWNLPHCLEKEYDGFKSKRVVADFREFAELCFWEFGDRVKWWTTVNEPWTYAVNGYVKGNFPPSQVSVEPRRALTKLPAYRSIQDPNFTLPLTRSNSSNGNIDPAKDAYTVARNLLLAHSEAVHSYRTKFKPWQEGQIGIVLNSHWHVPLDENSQDDKDACKRAVDFMLGWFLNPVLYGDYPQNMKDYVPPDNLAHFTPQESEMLKGSVDFVGLNYYTTNYASNDPNPVGVGYDADQHVDFTWVSDKNDFKQTAIEACNDDRRRKYHEDHLFNILKAMIIDKVNVKGYFVWSFCDNFEWSEGYTVRFGITYIDFLNNLTRYPKNSALWFAQFLKNRRFPNPKKRQIEEKSDNGTKKRLRTVEE